MHIVKTIIKSLDYISGGKKTLAFFHKMAEAGVP
uniref:Uncharacterized protein n=1 Tax=Anguilla anguilla TaxID=7936 RepID=A0A0E9VBY6_ANGAN